MAHVRLFCLGGEVLAIQRIGPHPKLQELEITTPYGGQEMKIVHKSY